MNKIFVASVAATRQFRLMSLFAILPTRGRVSTASGICYGSFNTHTNFCIPKDTCPNFMSLRNSSSQAHRETRKEFSLTAEDFKKAIDTDDVYVIDVREPQEVDEGRVPAKRWVNVPVGLMFSSLLLSDDRFLHKFGSPKPCKDEKIVFMCKGGVRSTKGLHIGQEMGYKNSKHYPGGWKEWSKIYPDKKV